MNYDNDFEGINPRIFPSSSNYKKDDYNWRKPYNSPITNINIEVNLSSGEVKQDLEEGIELLKTILKIVKAKEEEQ